MVKILKRGKLPSERLFRCECRQCNTQFEFEAKEAQRDNDPREGTFYRIPCPLCSYMVYVYPKDVVVSDD